MPSTLSKIVLPGILFPLILLISLICPLSVRADEPVPTSQPGEIYRAFNTKPQQLRDKSQRTDAERSSYLEDAPRFSSPSRQTAPLAALMDEKPVKGSPLREPARLFEDESSFSQGQPMKAAYSAPRSAEPIETIGSGQASRANHLRPSQEQANSSINESFPGNAPVDNQGLWQASAQESSRPLAKDSGIAPTPLPESSLSSHTPLPPEGKSNQKESSSGIIPMLITMGGALFLVIGLFLVFAWMMRRTSMRTGGMLPQGVVEVLGHQVITGRQQVHLLRIGKRLLLVAVSPDSIETLTEITDPMEVDRIAGVCRQSGPGSSTGAFQAVMRQFSQDSNQSQDPIPTVDQLRQRLGG